MKHIEEKKLKNIQKIKKKENDAKTAFTHDAHYIERRKHKRIFYKINCAKNLYKKNYRTSK